jgi:hypothetical protein
MPFRRLTFNNFRKPELNSRLQKSDLLKHATLDPHDDVLGAVGKFGEVVLVRTHGR